MSFVSVLAVFYFHAKIGVKSRKYSTCGNCFDFLLHFTLLIPEATTDIFLVLSTFISVPFVNLYWLVADC